MKTLIIKKKLLLFIFAIFVFLGMISIFCVLYENSLNTYQENVELDQLGQQLNEFYEQLTVNDETLLEVSEEIDQPEKNNGITLILNKDKSKMLASEIDQMVTDKVKKEISNNLISADDLNTLLQSEIRKIYDSILNWNSDSSAYVLSEQEKEYIISSTVKIVEEDLLKNINDDSSKYLELEKVIKSNEEIISGILSDLGKIKNFSKDIDQTNSRIDLLELEEGVSSNEFLNQLNELQKLLTNYTDAVKAGDEEARTKLQKELEEYSKSLDDATREHIKEVLESTTDEIDEKLEVANQSIAGLETELTNSITENATAIEKEKSANLADVNSITADLKELAQDADKDADREKYEAALSQIADNRDGIWVPKDNVTPTKALSVYNSVINETKIENRITEVSDNIDSNMMKAEFSPDGTTLTITVPGGN